MFTILQYILQNKKNKNCKKKFLMLINEKVSKNTEKTITSHWFFGKTMLLSNVLIFDRTYLISSKRN